MRAFISLDLEGLPHVVSPEHLSVKKALYGEARKIATEVVKITAMTLHELGFEEVVVADSHGPMVNVIPEEMPGFVKLVRGFPRPLSMVAGGKGSDVAIFLGYHARSGVRRATFDHTYSGSTIDWITVNGRAVSETLLNAYLLGEWGVPVILVAGDRALLESDVRDALPETVGVSLKESFSRYSAISPSMEAIKKLLMKGTKEAVKRWKEGAIKPLSVEKPVKVGVRFLNSGFADVAELCSLVRRIDGKTVEFETNSVEEAYKMIELLIFAATGVRAMFG